MSADSLPSENDLIDLLDELLASWNARKAVDVRIEDDTTLARFGVGYGLTAHVHRLAMAAAPLLARGLVLEAMPIVRAGYEAALTAVWCVQVQGGPIALANKHVRQQKALVNTLNESQSLASIAAKIPVEQPIPGGEEIMDDSFKAICDSLEPGGADAYAHYRLMSSMTHPSAFLCDFYLYEDATVPLAGFRLRDEPEQPVATPYLAMLVASVVWSGRAIDYLDKRHPRRSQLRAAAKKLGINSELQPTGAANARKRPR